MKKQLNEPDFIGGQDPLTEKEEKELREYFEKKRKKISTRKSKKSNSTEKGSTLAS